VTNKAVMGGFGSAYPTLTVRTEELYRGGH
jgi:hypothetical protein